MAPKQICTIIQCYKDTLWTELFPSRDPTWVPKTLIFAKDDNDTLDSVAVRLVKIQSRLEQADVELVKAAANGKDLVQIAREMTAAAGADFQAGKTDAEIEAAKQEADCGED